MKTLRIADGLALPLDFVTASSAILARRGAGKTYTGSVIVEEVIRAQVPTVVIDPTGAWWGLRSSVDGEKPGLPVVIFGGDHGDVPLGAGTGKEIADVVLEHPGWYVIDLSAFESRRSEIRFAADFLERLYRGKKRETGAMLLVVDEADMLAPQRPGEDQTRTLGAVESIVRRGRIKGLGDLLITQRAAVLNKNVLTQTEVLIVMQTTGPQDRAAIDEWIEGNATKDERSEVIASLASLEQGEAWIWSPALLRILKRVRVRRRTTFDSSRTPAAGEMVLQARAFAKIDLQKLGERIARAQEVAKANDPNALKARLVDLEHQLASRPAAIAERIEVPVEVQVLDPAVVDKLFVEVDRLEVFGKGLVAVAEQIKQSLVAARDHSGRNTGQAPRAAAPGEALSSGHWVPFHEPKLRETEKPSPVQVSTVESLNKAQKTFLSALAQNPAGLSRSKLSLITGYSAKSGHFANVLGTLRTAGYVNRGEPIMATPEGIAAVPDFEPLPRPGQELVEYWAGQLDRAGRAMLEAFVGVYPAELEREALAEQTGYSSKSGHFANVLGRLRTLGLVTGYRASQELMG